MNIVVITHPVFLSSKSMPLFASALISKFKPIAIISPAPIFSRLPVPLRLKKWLGYIDQYILFPFVLSFKAAKISDALFVFSDQALGPWVPLISSRPHVIHCHDFLALRSALGEIKENPTSITGKIYQKYIRWGFSKGRNFISVSKKTRSDLHRLAKISPLISEVIYNPINCPYAPIELAHRLKVLQNAGLPTPPKGFILHVGGGQWYKNRLGVVEIYAAYAASVPDPLPLWMIGPTNQSSVLSAIKKVPAKGEVYLFSDVDAEVLRAVYSHAAIFLFPSLEEGFGWPIVEAQASGIPVLTTNMAPMTEVGGEAAFYLPRRSAENSEVWAKNSAIHLHKILSLDENARSEIIARGIENTKRFDPDLIFSSYYSAYERIFENSSR